MKVKIMADKDFILTPASVILSVNSEPYFNALNLFLFLESYEEYPGMSDRLAVLVERMTPQQKYDHMFVADILWGKVRPERNFESFGAFVDYLAQRDTAAIQEDAFQSMWYWTQKQLRDENRDLQPPDLADFYDRRAEFLDILERNFIEYNANETFRRDYWEEAIIQIANDPDGLKDRIVTHLRTMWEDVIREDFESTYHLVEETVAAFQKFDLSDMTLEEAMPFVTGRDVPTGKFEKYLNEAKKVIFFPSAYIGPYITMFPQGDALRLVFGVRKPEGSVDNSPSLNRSELLVRLNALADDTRLRVMELFTQHEELCAQDIIVELELSQSAASRHLRQLSATGYIVERTRQGAKCYSLNPARVQHTIRALENFLQIR